MRPQLHVQAVNVINPKTHKGTVTRYALVDDRNVVWIGGRSFGMLWDMTSTDRSTTDCRHLLRETPEQALRDKFTPSLDANDPDAEWVCYAAFDRHHIGELINIFGVTRAANAYFEHSGSSVVRDFHYTEWIKQGLDAFGRQIVPIALAWYDTTSPKHMPTSYLNNDPVSQGRKVEWIGNIKHTATVLLKHWEAL